MKDIMSNLSALREFITAIKSVDEKDSEQFRYLLVEGMKLLNLFDKDIAHEFGASRPTVNRWKNGIDAPHPAMRRPVYRYLANALKSVKLSTCHERYYPKYSPR